MPAINDDAVWQADRVGCIAGKRAPTGPVFAARWFALPKRQRRPLNIERRPPEHPAQNPYALFLDLFGSEQFVGVFGTVVAAQSQAIAG